MQMEFSKDGKAKNVHSRTLTTKGSTGQNDCRKQCCLSIVLRTSHGNIHSDAKRICVRNNGHWAKSNRSHHHCLFCSISVQHIIHAMRIKTIE